MIGAWGEAGVSRPTPMQQLQQSIVGPVGARGSSPTPGGTSSGYDLSNYDRGGANSPASGGSSTASGSGSGSSGGTWIDPDPWIPFGPDQGRPSPGALPGVYDPNQGAAAQQPRFRAWLPLIAVGAALLAAFGVYRLLGKRGRR